MRHMKGQRSSSKSPVKPEGPKLATDKKTKEKEVIRRAIRRLTVNQR